MEETKGESWRFPDNASYMRSFVYDLTKSKSFGGTILVIILLNTAVLLVQTEEDIRVKWGMCVLCNILVSYKFLLKQGAVPYEKKH